MSNLFTKWKDGLARTSKTTFNQIATLLGPGEVTEDTFEELEATLIQADIGFAVTRQIIDSLQLTRRSQHLVKTESLFEALRLELRRQLQEPTPLSLNGTPTVILIVGVNGSGKTTTIAKLAHLYSRQGKKIILGAADTYRAAAVDQLQIWAERLGLPVISGQPGGDSAAVAFDTVQAAINRKLDVAIIDTAGRLHTRYNLMEELKKVYRVVGKALDGAPQATWIVLDATTGQNAIQQARAFKDAVKINGVILAKLDSSSKGGMVFAIQKELGLPVVYAGLGEKSEDLEVFDPDAFIEGILGK